MIELFVIVAWIVGTILAIMWLFLPWIMISKLDKIIEELKRLNKS